MHAISMCFVPGLELSRRVRSRTGGQDIVGLKSSGAATESRCSSPGREMTSTGLSPNQQIQPLLPTVGGLTRGLHLRLPTQLVAGSDLHCLVDVTKGRPDFVWPDIGSRCPCQESPVSRYRHTRDSSGIICTGSPSRGPTCGDHRAWTAVLRALGEMQALPEAGVQTV